MNRLMNKMMLSCKRATELMDKKAYVNLSSVENFQLFLHTRMCDACRLYKKQSRLLESILKKQAQEPDESNHATETLSKEIKSQIINKLEKK